MTERWICPFCNHAQIITEACKQEDYVEIDLIGGLPMQTRYGTVAYACTNPDCRRISLSLSLSGFVYQGTRGSQQTYLNVQLLPRSSSKPQPDYIPKALVEDYNEACSICDLSPKAAATLVRRCLQGMIRDFCGIIDKRTLFDEISSLKVLIEEGRAPSGVTEESVEAIDRIRTIGNIGAHMEKDINVIVDVDPGEARVLIELVEMLFEEWYVARHRRRKRLEHIKQISENKKDARGSALPDLSAANAPDGNSET